MAALENPSPSRIAGQVAALYRRLGTREVAPLREVMLLWAQQVARRRIGLDLEIRDMAEMERLHESGELEEYFAARLRAWQDAYRAEGRAQGIEQGIAEERDLLCRLAARKFGASVVAGGRVRDPPLPGNLSGHRVQRGRGPDEGLCAVQGDAAVHLVAALPCIRRQLPHVVPTG